MTYLQVGAESYGSTLISPVHGAPFSARNTALEGLFGARVHANDFVFGAAFGPSFAEATGSASRVSFNIAFAPQLKYERPPLKYERPPLVTPLMPNDRDQDGIADAEDGCPDQKGPARPDSEQNGCPDVTPLHPDRDDDGVADTDDACPTVQKRDMKLQCRVVFSPAVTLSDSWNFSGFSQLPIAAHGADLNGDGFSDQLLADRPIAYVVFGKRSGHAPVDVTALDDAGFSFAAEAGEQVDAVATIGDVNGDGIADYAIGVSTANAGTGRVYVVFGDKY
jgi:hypothetical protein